MIKALFSDFSYVILFPRDAEYAGGLNNLYREKYNDPKFVYDDYFKFNIELLKFYDSLRSQINVYIFTSGIVQEHTSSKKLTDQYVDEVISAQSMTFSKNQPEAYDLLLKQRNLLPNECIFIDDSISNIEAAKSTGIWTIQYKNNEDVIGKVTGLLEHQEYSNTK